MKTYLRTKLLQVFSVGLCLGSIGCQQGFNLTKHPIDSAFVHSHQSQNNKVVLPIVLDNIISNELFAFFSEKLIQAGLYGEIYRTSPSGNYIHTRLIIDKAPVSIAAILLIFPEAVLYGGSFSLLAPLLPIKTDFEYKYTLSVRWPNGINATYSAKCAATASINFPTFGDYSHATRQKAMYQEAQQMVDKTCLNSLVNQMSDDYALMTKGYGDSKPISQPVIDYQSPTSPGIPTQPSAPTISKKKANVEPKQQIGELE